jgi:hypothetical protein
MPGAKTSALLVLVALSCGCQRKPTTTGAGAPSASASASSARALVRPHAERNTLRELERVTLQTGGFRAGSEPGEPGRVPSAEPPLQDVELGGY